MLLNRMFLLIIGVLASWGDTYSKIEQPQDTQIRIFNPNQPIGKKGNLYFVHLKNPTLEQIRIVAQHPWAKKMNYLMLEADKPLSAGAGDQMLEVLTKIPMPLLSRLFLENMGMTAKGIRILGKAKWGWRRKEYGYQYGQNSKYRSIDRVRLNGNPLKDEGLKALSELPFYIFSLDLERTGFSAKGLKALANTPFLHGISKLDLRHNHIDDRGMYIILTKILPSPSIQEYGPVFTDKKIDAKNLSTVLAHLQPTEEALSFNFHPIGDEGAKILAKAPFKTLNKLNLCNTGLTMKGLQALSQAPWFQNISCLKLGRGMPHVEPPAKTGDAMIEVLAKAPLHITQLSLAGTGITSKGLIQLLKAPWIKDIQDLDLSDNPDIKDDVILSVKQTYWPHLKSLNFDQTGLSDEGQNKIKNFLKSVKNR